MSIYIISDDSSPHISNFIFTEKRLSCEDCPENEHAGVGETQCSSCPEAEGSTITEIQALMEEGYSNKTRAANLTYLQWQKCACKFRLAVKCL